MANADILSNPEHLLRNPDLIALGIHLITSGTGFLPEFYERHGFKREKKVILVGLEM